MAEEMSDRVPEPRGILRRGKGKAKTDIIDEAGPSTQRRDIATPEPDTNKTEKNEAQAKERKKPRKLERRSVALEEPAITLDTRVDRLEQQFQALSSRVDAVEVRQVRRPTAMTYRRSSSTSTRATSAPRPRRRTTAPQRATSTTTPRPSLAEQLRESQRLRRTAQRQKSGDGIEEIPRTALTSTASQNRQVALTGQYNIPLPSNLTTEDVLNLKSGLTAAGSIARSLATALTASRDNGSGTTTPRVSTASAPTAGPSRSHRESPRSAPGPADVEDSDRNNNVPTGANVGAEGNANSPSGNRQPEERDVIGAENASKSWKSFIASAVTDLVTSAAKDAAVEIHQATYQQATTDVTRPAGGSASASRRDGSPFVADATDVTSAEGSRSSNAARRRPKASRTSSRASSFRGS